MSEASNTPSGFDYFSAESVAQAVRDLGEKSRLLHEARMEAFQAMREATAWHNFLVSATRNADEDEREMYHRLGELCKRQAMEMVA